MVPTRDYNKVYPVRSSGKICVFHSLSWRWNQFFFFLPFCQLAIFAQLPQVIPRYLVLRFTSVSSSVLLTKSAFSLLVCWAPVFQLLLHHFTFCLLHCHTFDKVESLVGLESHWIILHCNDGSGYLPPGQSVTRLKLRELYLRERVVLIKRLYSH